MGWLARRRAAKLEEAERLADETLRYEDALWLRRRTGFKIGEVVSVRLDGRQGVVRETWYWTHPAARLDVDATTPAGRKDVLRAQESLGRVKVLLAGQGDTPYATFDFFKRELKHVGAAARAVEADEERLVGKAELMSLALNMMEHIGPEREQSDPVWRRHCERLRELMGIHPAGC